MNKKLTVYGKGKRVDRQRDRYFIVYEDGYNKEIKNQIQVAFLNNYFSKRNYSDCDYRRWVVEELNSFSKRYNNFIATKELLDSDKLYTILKNNNNAMYGHVDIKKGRKVISTGFMLDKPLSEKLIKQLKKYGNVYLETNKSIYQYAPEIKCSIVYIVK